MPRELLLDPTHDRTRSLGWLAVAWWEHFCVHGPGDIIGRSLNAELEDGIGLDDELILFTVDCYGLADHGRRLYDSAFLSRPKGRDKSGHAGRITLFEALGPARFGGWAQGGEVYEDPWDLGFVYRYQPGEPMGRPVTSPFIRCLATEEGQAGNTYDNVYFNLTEGPLAHVPGIDPGLTRVFIPGGGEIRPSTASNAAKDGGKETFTVFDETHLYITPELRRMYATVRRNSDKRKIAEPWSFETSTMYAPGDESVAEATHKFASLIREGRAKASRLLFDHREAPPDVDLSDEEQLRAALKEVYGPFYDVMDVDRIVNSIWDPRADPSDSRRYFLNQPTSAIDAWLAAHEIRSAAKAGLDKAAGGADVVTVGFDGSRSRVKGVTDATGLVGCRVSDGHLFQIAVWEQPADWPASKGAWPVPVHEVEAKVAETFKRYKVVGFYADPAKWESQVAQWEADYGSRLKVKATRDHPIEWWMTGGRTTLTVRATADLHNAIVEGECSIDGSAAFVRHLTNARRRVGRSGIQIAKEHPESDKKIDLAVCAILARAARQDALAAGLGKAKTPARPRRIR